MLIEGAGGIFEVNVDGALVYSKHQTGQFPDEAALVDAERTIDLARRTRVLSRPCSLPATCP